MGKSFEQQRREFLDLHFPDLSVDERQRLAHKLRGYTNEQIGRQLRGGSIGRKIAECINPDTGVVQERLINPYSLSRSLKEIGFKTRVMPGFARNQTRKMLHLAWPCTLPLFQIYHVAAQKT